MQCKRLVFSIYRDGNRCDERSFEQGVLRVGSDAKSHLQLDGIDRMHAVLEATGNQVELVDLGSSGGTKVNGTRIEKCALKVGDRLALGPWEVRLDQVTEPEASAVAVFDGFASKSDGNPFARAAAANPFLAAAAPRGYGTGEDYALIRSGAPVPSSEVELENVSAVEVTISWGNNVLHVAHLTPPRSFYVGDEQGKNLGCDFLVPSETLGVSRAPVVVERGGNIFLVVPSGAKGSLRSDNGEVKSLTEAIQGAAPSAELSGACEVQLASGTHAVVESAGLTFRVATVKAGKPVPRGLGGGDNKRVFGYFGASLLTATALIGAFAAFVPPMGLLDDEGLNKDRMYMMQAYLNAASEREREKIEEQTKDEDSADAPGGEGERAKGDEGKMGKELSRDVGRFGIKGPKDNKDVQLAQTKAAAENFGILGLLAGGLGGDPNAPTAPFGRDTSLGNDDSSADGNMWGESIHEAGGVGGLGLSGLGQMGGGFGEGIGLGDIGVGHGAGRCTGTNTGNCQGFGFSRGIGSGDHATKAPKIRPQGVTVTSGRLPPEVIQRVVRQNYGQFRMCYENGLRGNPNLAGRVAVRFVIGSDGSVSNASNGGSDLPDAGVVSCVVRGFYSLGFPSPDSGIVTVVYPIMFSPG